VRKRPRACTFLLWAARHSSRKNDWQNPLPSCRAGDRPPTPPPGESAVVTEYGRRRDLPVGPWALPTGAQQGRAARRLPREQGRSVARRAGECAVDGQDRWESKENILVPGKAVVVGRCSLGPAADSSLGSAPDGLASAAGGIQRPDCKLEKVNSLDHSPGVRRRRAITQFCRGVSLARPDAAPAISIFANFSAASHESSPAFRPSPTCRLAEGTAVLTWDCWGGGPPLRREKAACRDRGAGRQNGSRAPACMRAVSAAPGRPARPE